MQIELEMTNSILIAKLKGDIDHHNAGYVRSRIDEGYESMKLIHIIMDFSEVSFMDSSGIGVLMGRYNKVKEQGGNILICGCRGYMHEILSMAGIFTIVKEFEDIDDCLSYIKKNGGGK